LGGEKLAFEDHVDKAIILNLIDLQKRLGLRRTTGYAGATTKPARGKCTQTSPISHSLLRITISWTSEATCQEPANGSQAEAEWKHFMIAKSIGLRSSAIVLMFAAATYPARCDDLITTRRLSAVLAVEAVTEAVASCAKQGFPCERSHCER
jgi:hypothetical protein